MHGELWRRHIRVRKSLASPTIDTSWISSSRCYRLRTILVASKLQKRAG